MLLLLISALSDTEMSVLYQQPEGAYRAPFRGVNPILCMSLSRRKAL